MTHRWIRRRDSDERHKSTGAYDTIPIRLASRRTRPSAPDHHLALATSAYPQSSSPPSAFPHRTPPATFAPGARTLALTVHGVHRKPRSRGAQRYVPLFGHTPSTLVAAAGDTRPGQSFVLRSRPGAPPARRPSPRGAHAGRRCGERSRNARQRWCVPSSPGAAVSRRRRVPS